MRRQAQPNTKSKQANEQEINKYIHPRTSDELAEDAAAAAAAGVVGGALACCERRVQSDVRRRNKHDGGEYKRRHTNAAVVLALAARLERSGACGWRPNSNYENSE
jgi:hypothetical protein